MNGKREVARFFVGATAWEAVGHFMLAFSGLLPLKVWGITVTPTFNTIWILVVAAFSSLLAWYAWGKGERREPRRHVGDRQAQV